MKLLLEPVANLPSATSNGHRVTGTKWSLTTVSTEEHSAPCQLTSKQVTALVCQTVKG